MRRRGSAGGGERCPVLKGEDELNARRGAGNVSSRPEPGKTLHTHIALHTPIAHQVSPSRRRSHPERR